MPSQYKPARVQAYEHISVYIQRVGRRQLTRVERISLEAQIRLKFGLKEKVIAAIIKDMVVAGELELVVTLPPTDMVREAAILEAKPTEAKPSQVKS